MEIVVAKIVDIKWAETHAQYIIDNIINYEFYQYNNEELKAKFNMLIGELGIFYELGFIDCGGHKEIFEVINEKYQKRLEEIKKLVD